MKIVVFSVALAPYRIDFFNSLVELGATGFYFTQNQVEGSPFLMEKMVERCRFIPKFLRSIKFLGRRLPWGIGRILKEEQPDCVLVPEFSLVTLCVCLLRIVFRRRYRIISICDDSIDMIHGNEFSRLHAWARRVLVPFCDDLVLLDKKACEWYQQHYGKGMWFPLIRDERTYTHELAAASSVAEELMQHYDLAGKKIVLFVGRLVGLKNVDVVINAMSGVGEDSLFVIVGDGEKREELEAQARAQRVNTLFVGWQSGVDLLAWYRLAHVFVLASSREAFGAVVNEALLAGCRVCVSERAGSACLVNADNGTLFSPDAHGALRDILGRELESISTKKTVVSLMPITYQSYVDKLVKIV